MKSNHWDGRNKRLQEASNRDSGKIDPGRSIDAMRRLAIDHTEEFIFCYVPGVLHFFTPLLTTMILTTMIPVLLLDIA
jgi:hypothetical protein